MKKAPLITASVTALPGVGPSRAARLGVLGIETVHDLLFRLPVKYLDLSRLADPSEVQAGDFVTIEGRIEALSSGRTASNRLMLKAVLTSGKSSLTLIWFRPVGRKIPPPVQRGEKVAAAGKVTLSGIGLGIVHPELAKNAFELAQIHPVYPLTSGLTQKVYRRAVSAALPALEQIEDPLPDALRDRLDLPNLAQALKWMHLPDNMAQTVGGARRFAYDEALFLSLAVNLRKQIRVLSCSNFSCDSDKEYTRRFFAGLRFSLTKAQQTAVSDVRTDMESVKPMQRLIHGDVGSGKTVIAMYAVAKAAENRMQTAFLAPTRVLADQHFRHWSRALAQVGLNTALITGGSPPEKQAILEAVAQGQVDLLIGTHAILDVQFKRLGLVVIDEQQRFGVEQRIRLTQKGNPHCLYLSATPIPRSLGLVTCGDLDVTRVAEKPANRQPVETRWISPEKRDAVYNFVRRKVMEGEQAYVVVPRVSDDDENQEDSWAGIHSVYRALSRGLLKGVNLGMLHGGMASAEQETTLESFASGVLQVLVATTVIEVGVDVPSATIMVIEHADRFGLGQLHQLRGRVGRGVKASICLLIAAPSTPMAFQRIAVLRNTHDGFVLAEEDLKLRGPGELVGVQQSGFGALDYIELPRDTAFVEAAMKDAKGILADDPDLSLTKQGRLQRAVLQRFPSLKEVLQV